ncbi:uroporphyrinogen-III synthase [Haliea sp. E17]|uniref:uroporphyrinogen-III synthase n=1 Tax=Haliea sp. E17 TaxID=3401576 RepID=UPI003AAC2357
MATEPGVLVTRPAGQADALLEALAGAGLRAVHQPLLTLEPLPELAPQARQAVIDLDRYQHVIFVSANAVHFGMELIGNYWPQLPVGLAWYGVGVTTATLLREFGLDPISPPLQMDSEGLLAMESLQQVAGDRVLIVKGIGGRGKIAEVLAQRGAQVDELPCYRRYCPTLVPGQLAATLGQESINVVLISSGEGLENMLSLLSAAETTKFRDIELIVPSPRVAALAQQAGFPRVMTADNASDAAMLEALRRWRAGDK